MTFMLTIHGETNEIFCWLQQQNLLDYEDCSLLLVNKGIDLGNKTEIKLTIYDLRTTYKLSKFWKQNLDFLL